MSSKDGRKVKSHNPEWRGFTRKSKREGTKSVIRNKRKGRHR